MRTGLRCSRRSSGSTSDAPDYGAVLDDLLETLQRIAVLQLVGGRSDDEELAAVAPLAAQLGAEDTQLYYQIALNGRRDLPICRDPRMGFEMTMLRMLAFRPAADGAAPRARCREPRPRRRKLRRHRVRRSASGRSPVDGRGAEGRAGQSADGRKRTRRRIGPAVLQALGSARARRDSWPTIATCSRMQAARGSSCCRATRSI